MIKNLIGFLLLCTLWACQSKQSAHVERINRLQEQLVDETLKTDIETAQNLVGELEEYLETYSDSTSFVDYYILLGDLYSQTLKLPKKGLYFFQKVTSDHPKHEKAPIALFYQGYVLENSLSNYKQAKMAYELFLLNYPDHELRETVELSIQHLGIPLDELIKQFEEVSN